MVAEEERTSRMGEKEDEEYHKEDEEENEEWRKGAKSRQANHTKINQYKKERIKSTTRRARTRTRSGGKDRSQDRPTTTKSPSTKWRE